MRLLNSTTLKLEEFIGNKIPKYAILSHRWDNEEFTYKDSQDSQGIESILAGYVKIKGCCNRAARDGYEYVWVDSCCIDKSSSAELSEAINSMFKWYQKAAVCYAYLSDVPNAHYDHRIVDSPFRKSKWFTRGWTLQELLAPKQLIFFDCNWNPFPSQISTHAGRVELRLGDVVSEITGIKDLKNYGSCSVAQKMSWASKRVTTREEDVAYCLLGLFGVNMPPLYGEGEKAFLRLQLEILKMSDDETIFAWTDEKGFDGGMLASSPAAFKDSGNVERGKWDSPSYTMTNKGLLMNLRLMKHWANQTSLAAEDALLAPLNCNRSNQLGQLAVILRKVDKDQYVRTLSEKLIPMRDLADVYQASPRIPIYIRQYDSPPTEKTPFIFYIPIRHMAAYGYTVSEKYVSHPSISKWAVNLAAGELILTLNEQDTCAALMVDDKRRESFVLVIDVRFNCPGADVFIVKNVGFASRYCNFTNDTPRRDKATRRLPTGESLFMSLKERGIFSKHEYEVKMIIVPGEPSR